jgi:hypothetical protein
LTDPVEPLSNGVQVGLRLPVILLALVGAVTVLVLVRRVGVAAAVLAGLGSLFIAADQVVNIAWVLHTNTLIKESDPDINGLNTLTKLYTFADVALITIGVALVIVAIVVRRPAPSVMAAPTVGPGMAHPRPPGSELPAGFPAHPGYPEQLHPGQLVYPPQPGTTPPGTYQQ